MRYLGGGSSGSVFIALSDEANICSVSRAPVSLSGLDLPYPVNLATFESQSARALVRADMRLGRSLRTRAYWVTLPRRRMRRVMCVGYTCGRVLLSRRATSTIGILTIGRRRIEDLRGRLRLSFWDDMRTILCRSIWRADLFRVTLRMRGRRPTTTMCDDRAGRGAN